MGKEAEKKYADRLRLAGRRPCGRAIIDSALGILADAEEGTVKAFIVVGVGVDFTTVDCATGMTRQDRLILMGELQQQIHILSLIEQRQRDNGE